MSNAVQPHRRPPTRLRCPWDSPGKNPEVGCHFLLQIPMYNSSIFSCSSTSEVLLKWSRIINTTPWFLLTVRITQKIPQDWNMQLKFRKLKNIFKRKSTSLLQIFSLLPLLRKKPPKFIFWIMSHPVIKQIRKLWISLQEAHKDLFYCLNWWTVNIWWGWEYVTNILQINISI